MSLQPLPSIQRTDLLTAHLKTDPAIERVEIKRVDLTPGQAVGRHRHPCAVVGYIAAGRIKYQIDGEAARELHVGDAFFEPQDMLIAHFDNASNSEPASFIAFYLLRAGESRLIEMM
jgi:quercetin dioxygenase-like cupin family protein